MVFGHSCWHCSQFAGSTFLRNWTLEPLWMVTCVYPSTSSMKTLKAELCETWSGIWHLVTLPCHSREEVPPGRNSSSFPSLCPSPQPSATLHKFSEFSKFVLHVYCFQAAIPPPYRSPPPSMPPPPHIAIASCNFDNHTYSLSLVHLPSGDCHLLPAAVKLWNTLPQDLRQIISSPWFKHLHSVYFVTDPPLRNILK